MPFTAAAVQLSPRKGDVAANLDRIAELATQASQEGTDLALFPESAVSGYFLEGGTLEHSLTPQEVLDGLAQRLGGLARPLDIGLGFFERNGGQPYNSAAYMEFGGGEPRLVHVYRKFFLPTYGVFDEERFLSAGRELGVFDSRLGRFAFLICEDVWHSILATLNAVNGAQLLLVPSASPARGFSEGKPGNVLRYERMLRSACEEHGLYAVNAMLTGFEGGKGFVGSSSIFDPSGDMIVQSPIFEDHILMAEIDLDLVEQARCRTPLLGDLKAVWSRIVEMAGDSTTR